MKRIKRPSKEEIIAVYFDTERTMVECCEYFGIKSPITFSKWLKSYGLKGKDVNRLNSLEYKLDLTEEELAEKLRYMYQVEKKGLNKIARELGVTYTVISRRFERFGIPKIDPLEAKTVFGSGENSGSWKGGRYITSHGYVLVLDKNHPNPTKPGYVYEHRLVMEKELGRYLTPDEVVHHINEDKTDNRPSNLMVLSNAEHMALHHKLRTEGE